MPVPFATCTVRSSIVTVTSSATRDLQPALGQMAMHDDGRQDVFQGGLAAERAATLVDVRDELVAELRDVARDDDRVGVAERAQALAVDAVADVEQQVEFAFVRPAVLQLAQDGRQPACALAARRALATRLVL